MPGEAATIASKPGLWSPRRSRPQPSLEVPVWFNVLDPEADRYDAAVLIEFDPNDNIAAAWKLLAKAVKARATSRTTQAERRVLRLPGRWGLDSERAAHRSPVRRSDEN